ncbi:hydrogenase maturation nickel metallochaperone HypA [Actinomadura alba]|uniref:Hydrogenase maturation factor HypA n=1 Tax=Actinomadura alba TaxID=406431 RepID=A0ABR7LS35_9ACTN|nr:hydrogenase maturation nickel metallochaperone HypA [Actinomadura alba]MBC6467647.1 hydrogenase maturation nickel metallochaperone HypA [Actinomadura alba]
MHEIGLAEAVLEVIEKRAGGRRVAWAKVRAGALLRVVEPSMDQAFRLVAEGTVAEGAAIDLVVTPAQVTCRSCGHQDGVYDPLAVCPSCGGGDVDLSGGDELVLESIEIAEARDVPGNSRRDRGDPA